MTRTIIRCAKCAKRWRVPRWTTCRPCTIKIRSAGSKKAWRTRKRMAKAHAQRLEASP